MVSLLLFLSISRQLVAWTPPSFQVNHCAETADISSLVLMRRRKSAITLPSCMTVLLFHGRFGRAWMKRGKSCGGARDGVTRVLWRGCELSENAGTPSNRLREVYGCCLSARTSGGYRMKPDYLAARIDGRRQEFGAHCAFNAPLCSPPLVVQEQEIITCGQARTLATEHVEEEK